MRTEADDAHGGMPNPERLQAVVDLVVGRFDPDQIILFGSAARGEMSADSDLDLLVLRDRGLHEREVRLKRWDGEGPAGTSTSA